MFGLRCRRLASRPRVASESPPDFQFQEAEEGRAAIADGPRCRFEVWAISFAHLSTLPRLLERSILAGKVVSHCDCHDHQRHEEQFSTCVSAELATGTKGGGCVVGRG